MAWKIKENDTRPAYVVTLKDNFGLPGEAVINLTTATKVDFIMREKGTTGAPKVKRTMTIVNAANGLVQHNWQATDTDTPGTFEVEFEITWNDGGIETVPNDKANNLIIEIGDDLEA